MGQQPPPQPASQPVFVLPALAPPPVSQQPPPQPASQPPPPVRVIVTDVSMPFASMVSFMVKWAFASIPALLIISVLISVLLFLIFGVGMGFLATLWHQLL